MGFYIDFLGNVRERKESVTGTYIDGVRVSDDVPRIPKGIWFPKHGYKYFDRGLQRDFHSKTEKRNYMKAHNIIEAPVKESDEKRFDRAAEIVNTERKKQGLKPKTVSELRGDTIHQKV